MLEHNVVKFKYGNNIIKLENGFIARQSTSSVIASMDDTVVIITLVCDSEVKVDQSFLPLSVYYQEKFYSVGKIPGSFFRREGRPSDVEIITSRLIDRSIRPLFNDKLLNDIQITINVISVNPQISTDIISIIGVSAALSISGIPDITPISVARVGYINNNYILNPSLSEMNLSKLNLVIAGTSNAIFMIDCSSKNLNEKYIIDGIDFACNNFFIVLNNINFFLNKVSIRNLDKNCFNYLNDNLSYDINNYIYDFCINDLNEIYSKKYNKRKLINNLNNIEKKLFLSLEKYSKNINKNLVIKKINEIKKEIIINKLLYKGKRIDGRSLKDIRDIDIKVGFLPKRVHGSSLFTRGETQALVTITLGTSRDAQSFDDIFLGERIDNFIFHYNFPSYSVGEIGNIGFPKRREIGHGYLAKKGIIPILPDKNNFPYTIRIVSDILESNGSSSMASVCGASLALMDAGVPIKYHVAGIAMGLIKFKNKKFIISDIISDEDKLGDMDFKVVGTELGITALQMDMKVKGIFYDDIVDSLEKSKESRLYIIQKMNSFIKKPKCCISDYAPRIYKFKINTNKIKDVIGKGGNVIKYLTEKYNCFIEINNEGIVSIVSSNKKNIDGVICEINKIVEDIKIGYTYLVSIKKIFSFGLIVYFFNKKEGLVYIPKNFFKNKNSNIFNFFKIGQYINAKVLSINNYGKIKLILKDNFNKYK